MCGVQHELCSVKCAVCSVQRVVSSGDQALHHDSCLLHFGGDDTELGRVVLCTELDILTMEYLT